MSKVQMRADYPAQKSEKKPNKVKKTVSETTKATGRVVRNGENFVQAVALLILAGFAYVQVKEVTNDVLYFAVLASLIIVGLRGTYEVIRFLNKE